MKRAACYDVSPWHELQWSEERAAQPTAPKIEAAGDKKVAGFGETFLPELFERLYTETPFEVPAKERDRAATVRGKLHDLVSELPEWTALRADTVRDPERAAIAALAVAETLSDTLPDLPAPPDADKALHILESLQEMEVTGRVLERAKRVAAAAKAAVEAQAGEIDESSVRRALRAGIGAIQDAFDEADEACEALGLAGMGPSRSTSGRPAPVGVTRELAKRVHNSPELRRIMELAGRLKATARAKRATRTQYARSELSGVECTDNFARLLPVELGALAGGPLRKLDLIRRVTEKAALGYRLRGRERATKGPIVVGLDISGSMAGDKDTWGKALALACLDIARQDKRAFAFILYNGRVVDQLFAPESAKVDPLQILKMLERGAFGGCDFDVPIQPCLDCVQDHPGFGKADILLITDAMALTDGAEAAKKRADVLGAHVYGILVGHGHAETLAAWSHEVVAIQDVSRATAATDLIFEGL